MQPLALGRSNLIVSRLTLRAQGFGTEIPGDDAFDILDLFCERGGTLIEVVDGPSEHLIAAWRRSRSWPGVQIATIGRFAGEPAAWIASSLEQALDTSLRRLDTDAIDLFQVQGPDSQFGMEEIARFLEQAVRAGKIRHAGASRLTVIDLYRLDSALRSLNVQPVVSMQPQQEYNLLARDIEWDLIPAATSLGFGTIVRGPLAQGWFGARQLRHHLVPFSRTETGDGEDVQAPGNHDQMWRILDELGAVSRELAATPTHVALAWLLSQPAVSTVVVGARTSGQLAGIMGVPDLALGADHLDRLSRRSRGEATPIPVGLLRQMAQWQRLVPPHARAVVN